MPFLPSMTTHIYILSLSLSKTKKNWSSQKHKDGNKTNKRLIKQQQKITKGNKKSTKTKQTTDFICVGQLTTPGHRPALWCGSHTSDQEASIASSFLTTDWTPCLLPPLSVLTPADLNLCRSCECCHGVCV